VRGDLLLMFTDGLVEAENDEAMEFGEERMFAVIRTLDSATAAERLKRRTSLVETFVGDHAPA
jgi:serine phosphatase RsbU (regulator of sigma subunit)